MGYFLRHASPFQSASSSAFLELPCSWIAVTQRGSGAALPENALCQSTMMLPSA